MAASKLAKRIVRGQFTPRSRVYTPNPGESKTEQSFKKECDVNHILKSFGAVKASPAYQEKLASATYGYAPSESFYEATNLSLESKALFDELPSALRKRFNNSPGELLAFVENDENYDEASALGLVPISPDKPPAEPAPEAEKAESDSSTT